MRDFILAIDGSAKDKFMASYSRSNRFFSKLFRRAQGYGGAVVDENGVATFAINDALVSEPYDWGIDYPSLAAEVEECENNPDVKAVVFDINSPGGALNGVFDCADAIASLSKPKAAFVSGMACSAAYLLASATGQIFCTEAAEVGSIGVMASFSDWSEEMGIKTKTFVSSNAKMKNIDPFSEEGEAVWQDDVDHAEALFIKAIANNRGVTSEDIIENYGNGLVFYGADALERGMVDGIVSGIDEVINKLTESSPSVEETPEGSEEGDMDITALTDDELKAEVLNRPSLLASIKEEGAKAEQERVDSLKALSVFGAYAEPVVEQAISEGWTKEQALEAIQKAALEYTEKAKAEAEAKEAENKRVLDAEAEELSEGVKVPAEGALDSKAVEEKKRIVAAAEKINAERATKK